MAVTGAIFRNREPDMDPEWLLTITVEGSGFVTRAAPFAAYVGSIPVKFLVPDTEGTRLFGLLAAIPQAGDILTVGYLDGPQEPTNIVFAPADVV